MHKYGLEKVDEVDVEVANLKRFKPGIKKEDEEAPAPPKERRVENGVYDHHAEIMAEKREAEM